MVSWDWQHLPILKWLKILSIIRTDCSTLNWREIIGLIMSHFGMTRIHIVQVKLNKQNTKGPFENRNTFQWHN